MAMASECNLSDAVSSADELLGVYLSALKLRDALPDLPILFQAVPYMECARSV